MKTTIIIGRDSNLSQHLMQEIDNCVLISSRDVVLNTKSLEHFKNNSINLIFNNFQPATQLGNIGNPQEYIQNSILSTAIVLNFFKNSAINKIIYTSSSSVYGRNTNSFEGSTTNPLNLHSSLKLSNELLITQFCEDNCVDYTITRVFNMFGGFDNFSIISKLIKSIQESTTLKLINNGEAIRDFIHVNNVVEIYIKLLSVKNIPILNIGTGTGDSIGLIIKYFRDYCSIDIKNTNQKELKKSVAKNDLLMSIIAEINFISARDYIKDKLDL